MKIKKTLIDFIDDSLGILDEVASMLLVCDSFTLNDTISLSALINLNFFKQGGGSVIVSTSLPSSMLFDDIRTRFTNEDIPIIMNGLEEYRGYYIDTVGKEKFQLGENIFRSMISIDNDPNKILYEISFLRDKIKKNFPEIPVMISYHNFSSSIIDFGPETVLKMYRKLTTKMKQKGDIIIGLVNRDIHDSQTISTLIHLSDFVLELASEERGGVKQPYMQVLKSPVLEPDMAKLQQRCTYVLSGTNFQKITSQALIFNDLKRNITYSEDGTVSINNVEYLITPLETFTLLFKELEKSLAIEEYCEFMKNFGRLVGLEVTNLFRSKYGLEGDELLKRSFNYLTIRGWGKLIKKEGNLESGKMKLSFFSTLAHNYGESGHKVCVVGEGVFPGILEVVTGRMWTCEETKCIAMGDELCEFEAIVEK